MDVTTDATARTAAQTNAQTKAQTEVQTETPAAAPTVATVRAALATVRDPELDQDLVELDFVAGLEVEGADVHVDLRLPTYFCAPNFAWLMVADARAAVAAVPGVASTTVTLLDHFASDAITTGVDDGASFADAFPNLADGDLDDLRATFVRKAFVVRQERLVRDLLAAGHGPDEIAAMTLRDAPPTPVRERCLQARRHLGLPTGPDAALLVDPDDARPVPAERVDDTLRAARLTRVSVEGNAAFCRGLLATRYGDEVPLPHHRPGPGPADPHPSPEGVPA